MSDMLERGAEWLESVRRSSLSATSTFTYHPNGGISYPITGVTKGTDGRNLDTNSIDTFITVRDMDFIVPVDELDAVPKAGDEIRETQNGVTYRFRVMAHNSQPEYRYHDRLRSSYRIYTTRVN